MQTNTQRPIVCAISLCARCIGDDMNIDDHITAFFESQVRNVRDGHLQKAS